MSNIVTELESSKTAAVNAGKTEKALNDVKLLMDADAGEDLRLSNALGKNHSLARAQQQIGFQIELEKLDKAYLGQVFKIQDIKNLCVKYNMRFLKSKHFAGHLDVSVFAKLKQFAKDTKTEISDGNLEHNFFILAPSESFKLNPNRLPHVNDDPALFYKVNDGHYRLVHKWGKDFTVVRFIKGLLWRNLAMRFWLTTFFVAAIMMAVSAILINAFSFSPSIYLFSLLSIAISFLINKKIYLVSSKSRYQLFSNHTWNSEHNNY